MKKIIIAFANHPQAPLQSVTEEDEGIHNTLNAANRGNYSVHRESFATVSNINTAFSTYGADIAIFHYAGHAGEQSLLFNDQAANGQGLAFQLKPSADAGNLRLVILNGCSTGAQVDQLLALGVPAVIATSAAINDRSARIFGTEFFQNVCNKSMSIRQAFDAALAAAQLASSAALGVDAPAPRDLNLPGKTPREPFWGLFFNTAAAVDQSPCPALRAAHYPIMTRMTNCGRPASPRWWKQATPPPYGWKHNGRRRSSITKTTSSRWRSSVPCRCPWPAS